MMARHAPDGWVGDLARAMGGVGAGGAQWVGDLNAERPWCPLVGEIRMSDGRRLVMKYHTDRGEWEHEVAANRFLEQHAARPIHPACVGRCEEPPLIVFERLDGVALDAALAGGGGPPSVEVLQDAARALGSLHRWGRSRGAQWLAQWPADARPELIPGYDRSDQDLAAPFARVGETLSLREALPRIRARMAEPGQWLGFCHGDLQVRHVHATPDGVRFIDWERAGLRHQMYDLACLLTKPQCVGRRIPARAQAAAVRVYCEAAGTSLLEMQSDLSCIIAYESLIDVAENDGVEPDLAAGAVHELVWQTADTPFVDLHRAAVKLQAAYGATGLQAYIGLSAFDG